MKSGSTRSCVMLIGVLFGVPIQASEPPSLAHNPFARPPSEAISDNRGQLRIDGSDTQPDLRATMVAPSNSLANVAGKILRVGDEFKGFTLLKIFENRAIFRVNGKSLTVYVKPVLVTDNE